MKKNKSKVIVIGLFFIAVLFGMNSCRKVAADTLETKCTKLVDELSEAYSAYGLNPSRSTCEAARDATEAYIDGCNVYGSYNATWEAILASWEDCSSLDN